MVGASGAHAWEGTAAPRDPSPTSTLQGKLNVKCLLSELSTVGAGIMYTPTHTFFFIPTGSRVTCAFSFKVSKVNQILAGKL